MNALQVAAHGYTHVGKVRDDNQDSIRFKQPDTDQTLQTYGHLYAVADGMGGYEHGSVASTHALETFFGSFYSGTPTKSPQNMRQGVQAANLAVYQMSQRLNARMGTTLTAVNMVGNRLYIAHIGDSRVYLVRGRKPICLTNDHTTVGELVRMRVLSPDKVRTHERRSVLEKCLGMQLFVQPDVTQYSLAEGDYLILCTDGVWAYVQDDEFADIALDVKKPDRISQTLVDLAMDRDSDDNLSAVVIHVEELASVPAAVGEKRGRDLTQFFRSRLTGKA